MLHSQNMPRSPRAGFQSRVASSFRRTSGGQPAPMATYRDSVASESGDPLYDTFWSPLRLDELLASGPESTLQSLLGSGRDLWEDDESYERFLADLEEAKRTMKAQGRRDA